MRIAQKRLNYVGENIIFHIYILSFFFKPIIKNTIKKNKLS